MKIVTLTMNPAIDLYADVPHVVAGHKLRCSAVRRDAGGGGINAARVVARLGGTVRAIYPIGGPIGALLEQLVAIEGVASDTVPTTESTREDFTVDERETGLQYRFILPGPKLSKQEWQACLSLVERSGAQPQYFVASGSLPIGVPDDLLARALSIAKSHAVKTVVDTSGAALRACLEEGVFLVKPSLRELEQFVGSPLPIVHLNSRRAGH